MPKRTNSNRDRGTASRSRPETHRGRKFSRGNHRRKQAGGRRGLPEQLPLAVDAPEALPSVLLGKPTSHPNIFRKRIRHMDGHPSVGDWVVVYAEEPNDPPQGDETADESSAQPAEPGRSESPPRLLGYGIYNPKSEVAVRMVRWGASLPDSDYWQDLVSRAISLRHDLLDLQRTTDCYRIIHAEADGFPGMVVDRYANCLSAEIFSAGMAPRAMQIVEMLGESLSTEHWLIQPGPHLQSQEGFERRPTQSDRLPKEVSIHEGEVRFVVNFQDSHKTGFFCDQRENRQRLAELCRGKSVLDLCCYTGGFSITAAKAGQAAEVTGVDLDKAPLVVAQRNAGINQVRAKFTQADAFAYMRDMLRTGRSYDVVVLDPPKLIRNRAELDEGTRRHFDLNRLAMQLVKPGGLLLTCSCAGLLQTADFTRLVRAAARSAFQPTDFNPNPIPRNMQILAQNGAAACHPISANCPETEYFKSMWLRL
ncbi:MAG: class I SAM-dependent rRNA methyltransferase [Aureliella sp.]